MCDKMLDHLIHHSVAISIIETMMVEMGVQRLYSYQILVKETYMLKVAGEDSMAH